MPLESRPKGTTPPVSPSRHVALLMSARQIASREQMFLMLAELLARHGFKVTILAAGPIPQLRAAVLPSLSLKDIDVAWARRIGLRLPHLVRMYASVPTLAHFLRCARPDVLFATSIPPNLAALGAKLLSGQQTRIVLRQSNVIGIPGSARYAQVRRRPRDWLIPYLYPLADAIIAVSDGVAENLKALRRIASDKIHVIPNGISIDLAKRLAAEPLDHPWFAPGGPPVLLAVGRLVRKKNYPLLLKAFARVGKSCAARLVILGEGPERSSLARLAVDLGIADRVDMPGNRSNPFAYMARARLFVLSSDSEGMASVLIEALACGCPIVSTDCPSGPAEILEEGKYGILIPTRNHAALADAIVTALNDIPNKARLVARAEHFAAERTVQRYLAVLVGGGTDMADTGC